MNKYTIGDIIVIKHRITQEQLSEIQEWVDDDEQLEFVCQIFDYGYSLKQVLVFVNMLKQTNLCLKNRYEKKET